MAENDTSFARSGFITKKGTPSGESAMFNKLPPGDQIGNQVNSDLAGPEGAEANMPMKKITPLGYPGSGAKE